ncbi:hypothetical protein EDC01DRAFT_666113 [Geopyxis carbonaria]|nr:hypothetical protein EDC01DRAFT_666113 [Geopyxis carbonaria]
MARTAEPEPLSPPTSPGYDDDVLEDEDLHDLEDPTSSNRTSLSSPPTSVDPGSEKQEDRHHADVSGRSSLSGLEDLDQEHRRQQSGNFRVPSLTLSQFSVSRSAGDYDDDDTFAYNQHTPIDDPESQWESEAPASQKRKDDPSSTPNIRSRKSATPSSKIYPRSSRHSGSSSKLHLHPSSSSRKQPHYYASRASSASYEEPREEKKAPLVLLHITLLLLPGAEEAILRKITPTTLERGLLIEHPRGDYQMLEELIFDSLGLDEESAEPDDIETRHANEVAAQMAAWEKSMGVRPLQGKKKWEVRVYAANGLMTQGAWKRVWPEMERIDVEVGPKGWRGKKTDELIQGFLYNRNGAMEHFDEKKKGKGNMSISLGRLRGKWLVGAVTIFVFLLVGLGAAWKFDMIALSNITDQKSVVHHEVHNLPAVEQIIIPDNNDKNQNTIIDEPVEEIIQATPNEETLPVEGQDTPVSEETVSVIDEVISEQQDSSADNISSDDISTDEVSSEAESPPTDLKASAEPSTPLKCVVDSKGELVLDSSSLTDPLEFPPKKILEEKSIESLEETEKDSTVKDQMDEALDVALEDTATIKDSDSNSDTEPEKGEAEDSNTEGLKSEDSESVEETGSPLLQDVFGAGQAWWKNFKS